MTTDEDLQHLKDELAKAKEQDRLEPVEASDAEQAERLTYDITPAAEEPEDARQEILTAFLIYIDTDGKAIATSEIDKVLENTKRRREADLPDFRRACQEVVEDVRVAINTQSLIASQMQMVQQAQAASQNQQLLQGLDLTKVKR